MPRFELLLILMIAAAPFLQLTGAQYWFQSGAQGDVQTAYNNGGSAMIQTVSPQPIQSGSLAYWVGETLSNGAFIQVGYEIPNQTGPFSTNCSIGGCTGSVNLFAGQPTWFWEYFPAGSTGSAFYGQIGPAGSVGANGTWNLYSFNASGNTWRTYINNKQVGQIDLGTGTSGPYPIVGIAEVAETNTNSNPMPTVRFRNLGYYLGGQLRNVPKGYATISFGKGSETNLQNTYGVAEVGNQTDYFMVGSALNPINQLLLWKAGYKLTISSAYDPNQSITGAGNYSAYSLAQISAPRYVMLGQSTRVIFVGWSGSGNGSYTGSSNLTTIIMDQNITETAVWQLQYLVNATSQYGFVNGTGWHNASSTDTVSLSSNALALGAGRRVLFTGWSNGTSAQSFTFTVSSPATLSANWSVQYMINGTSRYGNVSGSGWYFANSTATLSLQRPIVNLTAQSRLKFTSWSNGAANQQLTIVANSPLSVQALYRMQYLTTLQAYDAYGGKISPVSFNVSNNIVNGPQFFFANSTYRINSASYKGATMDSGNTFSVGSPGTVGVALPVYNVTVGGASVLGIPVDVQANLTFWNGTRLVTDTGQSGILTLQDVPYGYAYGYVEAFGEKRSISVSGGGVDVPTFVTISIFESVLAGLVLIYLIERIYFYEKLQERRARRAAGKGAKK